MAHCASSQLRATVRDTKNIVSKPGAKSAPARSESGPPASPDSKECLPAYTFSLPCGPGKTIWQLISSFSSARNGQRRHGRSKICTARQNTSREGVRQKHRPRPKAELQKGRYGGCNEEIVVDGRSRDAGSFRGTACTGPTRCSQENPAQACAESFRCCP